MINQKIKRTITITFQVTMSVSMPVPETKNKTKIILKEKKNKKPIEKPQEWKTFFNFNFQKDSPQSFIPSIQSSDNVESSNHPEHEKLEKSQNIQDITLKNVCQKITSIEQKVNSLQSSVSSVEDSFHSLKESVDLLVSKLFETNKKNEDILPQKKQKKKILPSPNIKRIKITNEQQEQIWRLHQTGISFGQISKKLNYYPSKTYVRNYILSRKNKNQNEINQIN